MTQKTDNQEVDRRKLWNRRRVLRKAAAFFLTLLLAFLPAGSMISGNFAHAAEFKIQMLQKGSMLADYNFYFFNVRVGTGIFYWIKSDGSPLFCVQKDRPLLDGLGGAEDSEEFGSWKHFSDQQYELVSLVLQSCGQRRGDSRELKPGEYLAGQAAVWGILTGYWESTDQLRSEMEVLYEHVGDWNEWTAAELIEDARKMTEIICQAIQDYYSDSSPYIPSFASKYPDKAPLWQAEWQDGICRITFEQGERADAVKDFIYDLPSGWSCQWEGDRITFQCEDPKSGTFTVSGHAPEGTRLGEGMPIGLIYIVTPSSYPTFQHLASGVEITAPWSCYFQLSIPEKPDDTGSWELEETRCYRHQEDFEAIYGAQLEKRDGETDFALEGAVFQPLEYFDASQLEDTVLDAEQIPSWTGWQARCPEEITGDDGRIIHIDRKTYHYEKTYCGGHPEPKIYYEGNSQTRREEIEEEAWAAWEEEAEACQMRCDYHSIDGSGLQELEADRDLAYNQFTSLVYGYAFKETKPPEGYQIPAEGTESEKIFLVSLQAGGGVWEEGRGLQISRKITNRTAAPAAARTGAAGRTATSSAAASSAAISSAAVSSTASPSVASPSDSSRREEMPGEDNQDFVTEESTASQSQAAGRLTRRTRAAVWLTSQLPALEKEAVDYSRLYWCIVDNFRETPEETTPEETLPEETTPEETLPDETTPEETLPEETLPEETTPEETLPEETAPEETSPEETPPEETPEETLPATVPEESASTKPETSGSGNGGGRERKETDPAVIPTEEVPKGPARQGWIEAFYEAGTASRSEAGKNLPGTGEEGWLIPKTGDREWSDVFCIAGALISSGTVGIILWIRMRKKGEPGKRKRGGKSGWMISAFFLLTGLMCGGQDTWGAVMPEMALVEQKEEDSAVIRYFADDEEGEEEGETAAFIPDEWYVDEKGQTYQLDFYRLEEWEIPETEEWQVRTETFYKVEDPAQIPGELSVTAMDDENKREGRGTLKRNAVKEISGSWADDFQVSLTFYDYGAETYQLGDRLVPGENVLEYLLEEQQLFLEAIGCSPLRYRIREFVWEGDVYQKDGLQCRNALALGSRFLSDYQAEFTGNLWYPPVSRTRWQAVYRILQEMPEETVREETKPQETSAAAPESETESEPEEKAAAGFRITRLLAAYTVSLAVLLPLLIFLLFWAGKRKKKASRK